MCAGPGTSSRAERAGRQQAASAPAQSEEAGPSAPSSIPPEQRPRPSAPPLSSRQEHAEPSAPPLPDSYAQARTPDVHTFRQPFILTVRAI